MKKLSLRYLGQLQGKLSVVAAFSANIWTFVMLSIQLHSALMNWVPPIWQQEVILQLLHARCRFKANSCVPAGPHMAKSMRWRLTRFWTPIKSNRTTTIGCCAPLNQRETGFCFSTTHTQRLTTRSSHRQTLTSKKSNAVHSHILVLYANKAHRYHISNDA